MQRIGHLVDHLQGVTRLHRALLQNISQRLTLHEIHREEVFSVLLAEIVDGNNVRMLELGGRAGFVKEPLDLLGGGPHGSLENLQGHQAVETFLARLVDHPDPAPRNLVDNIVPGERVEHLGRERGGVR